MTLVIAARCNEGIAFAYDKLIYEGGRPFPSVLEHKVCALGNLAIGVSGCILKPEYHVLEISKQYGGLFQNSNASSLMHGLVRSRSSNRFQELGFEGINMFPESYLFGFIEGGTPQLFFFDDRTSAEPQEVNFGAIGFGVYPEVVEYLESSPNPQKSIDDTMDCLNEAMQSDLELIKGRVLSSFLED